MTIPPTTITFSDARGSQAHRHIAVDLSQRTTATALQSLAQMTKRMTKIRSALVYTSRPGVGVHRQISPQDVVTIFAILGRMTNLTSVTVDLNRPHHYGGPNGGLPLNALIQLLTSSKRLATLELHQLDVTTKCHSNSNPNSDEFSFPSSTAWKELSRCSSEHKYLRTVRVINCMGKNAASVVGIIAKHARSLRHFQLVGTSVSSYALARLTLRSIHPHLKSLKLEELPDITNDEIDNLCEDLERDDCRLEELHIRSSVLTEAAGDRLALMLCLNTSLRTVLLHLDCERLAQRMPQCFTVNTTLRNVDIRCYGDDEAVCQNVNLMALALKHSTIQKLRLCLEIEPLEFQQDIIHAFAKMLLGADGTNNTSLQELILDDGIHPYPLSAELQLQLELNHCGYSRLIRMPQDHNTATPKQLELEWIQTLHVASDTADNLNVLYTILSNCPWLICNAATSTAVASTSIEHQQQQQEESSSGANIMMDNSSIRRESGSKMMDTSSKRRRNYLHYYYPHGLMSSSSGGMSSSRRNRSQGHATGKRTTATTTSSSTTNKSNDGSHNSHNHKIALPTRTPSGKTLKRMVKAILAPSA